MYPTVASIIIPLSVKIPLWLQAICRDTNIKNFLGSKIRQKNKIGFDFVTYGNEISYIKWQPLVFPNRSKSSKKSYLSINLRT